MVSLSNFFAWKFEKRDFTVLNHVSGKWSKLFSLLRTKCSVTQIFNNSIFEFPLKTFVITLSRCPDRSNIIRYKLFFRIPVGVLLGLQIPFLGSILDCISNLYTFCYFPVFLISWDSLRPLCKFESESFCIRFDHRNIWFTRADVEGRLIKLYHRDGV